MVITAGGEISLTSIADVAKANRLAAAQILTFGAEGLTIIFRAFSRIGDLKVRKRILMLRCSWILSADTTGNETAQVRPTRTRASL
ncbi:hypothetical protein ACL2DZ_00535 (plasmid) [Sinorhizobium meliloti]